MIMVVVGVEAKFTEWMATKDSKQRADYRPVRRWSDMLGFQNAAVLFMPDWREARDEDENERILLQAHTLEAMREAMRKPFQAPGKPA